MKKSIIKKTQLRNLNKKKGDDKVIITIVLTAVGVGLCVYFRTQIYALITTAMQSLNTSVTDLFKST